MNQDAILRDLAAERVEDLLPLLRRVFETGYREGMAAAGTAPPADAPTQPEPTIVPIPAEDLDATRRMELPVAMSSKEPAAAEGDPPEEEVAEVDEEEDLELLEETPAGDGQPQRRRFRGIRASATVGGLLRKIERVFRLEERFDLVVRVEHPGTGRALKRNMRLSACLKEG